MKEADLVIAHGSRTLFATALASAGLPKCTIYRQISDPEVWAGALPRRVRVRAYLRRMSHVVALWHGSREVLIRRFGVPAERISIVPNGAPADHFMPATAGQRAAARRRFGLPDDAGVAVYVGALVPEKGVASVIEAVSCLDGVYLLIVGHGPMLTELRGLAKRMCADRVNFAGPLQDVRDAYWASDAVVLASLTEQMPAVVIEAGLSGLPVVATGVGAIPEIVCDGVTGLLVSENIADLAYAIDRAIGEAALGAAARDRCVSEYSMEAVGSSWLAVLEQQVERSGVPHRWVSAR